MKIEEATDKDLRDYGAGRLRLVATRNGHELRPTMRRGRLTNEKRTYFRTWWLKNRAKYNAKKKAAYYASKGVATATATATAAARTTRVRTNTELLSPAPRTRYRHNPDFHSAHPVNSRAWMRDYIAFRKAGGKAFLPGAGRTKVIRLARERWAAAIRVKRVQRVQQVQRVQRVEQAQHVEQTGLLARVWNSLVGWSL